MYIIWGANLDQAHTKTTSERLAAHIPGTTEYEAEPPKSICIHLDLGTLNAVMPTLFVKDVKAWATWVQAT